MSNQDLVKAAIKAWADHDTTDAEVRTGHVRRLARYGVLSNRQIGILTGVGPYTVKKFSTKSDHTGGMLRPESLEPILFAMENEFAPAAVAKALDAGVSARMLSRLSGVPQPTLSRWAREARDE